MPHLIESITEVEYKTAASKEDYPVIFGMSNPLTNDYVLAKGKRSDIHDNVFSPDPFGLPEQYQGDEIMWRYVPLTKTIYWWKAPTMTMLQQAERRLKSKYGVEIEHNFFVDKEISQAKIKTFYLTSHPRRTKEIPNFQEWYKSHVGD